MKFYRYRDLQVIGYVGPDLREENDLKIPVFYLPVVQFIKDKTIITNYKPGFWGIVPSEQYAAEELYWFPDVAHSITRISPKRPAKRNHYWFFAEGSKEAEFLPGKKVVRRMIEFCDLKRREGDELLKLGDNTAALVLYERGAAVSQMSRDYARMLLCGVPPVRQERLECFIKRLEDDLETVVERAREEIFGKNG